MDLNTNNNNNDSNESFEISYGFESIQQINQTNRYDDDDDGIVSNQKKKLRKILFWFISIFFALQRECIFLLFVFWFRSFFFVHQNVCDCLLAIGTLTLTLTHPQRHINISMDK